MLWVVGFLKENQAKVMQKYSPASMIPKFACQNFEDVLAIRIKNCQAQEYRILVKWNPMPPFLLGTIAAWSWHKKGEWSRGSIGIMTIDNTESTRHYWNPFYDRIIETAKRITLVQAFLLLLLLLCYTRMEKHTVERSLIHPKIHYYQQTVHWRFVDKKGLWR